MDIGCSGSLWHPREIPDLEDEVLKIEIHQDSLLRSQFYYVSKYILMSRYIVVGMLSRKAKTTSITQWRE
jgi:hypothetical protein